MYLKISELQIENSKNDYIKYLLNNSIVPTNHIVSKYLNNMLESGLVGSPQFKPFAIKKNQVSDKDEWNKNFKNLESDLNILYQSIKGINNQLMNCEELYLAEKESIFEKIKYIKLLISNINYSMSVSNNIYTHAQTINSFYDCELKGDYSRNIPQTTSCIDLIAKNVKNNKELSYNSKVNIANSIIDFDSKSITPSTELGTIDSIKNDQLNEFYYVEYSNSSDTKDFISFLDITLRTPKYMSSICLECVSFSFYEAYLELSDDGIYYNSIHKINTNSFCEWMFDKQLVSKIRIKFVKADSDGFSGVTDKYYYIFKNLSCYNDEYESESTYVSNKISLNAIINDITLHSDESILPGTDIAYFIGLDNNTDPIEWKQIYNNESISLNVFKNRQKILNISLQEYGEYVGDNCYGILNMPNGYSNNDITLVSGYQMWKVETLDIPESEDTLKYEPNIEDYTDYYVNRRCLLDTEEYKFSIRNCKTHVFTQHVYCDKEHYVIDRTINAYGTSGGELKHKVYLNNMQVKCVNNKYNFTLKKGHNVVYILMYVTNSVAYDFSEIKHNFNFKEYTLNVFSSKPMKYINHKELRFNGLLENDKYYTIQNDKIIVKEDMNMINEHIIFGNLISDINYKNKSRYYLKYKHINSNKMHLIDCNNNTTTVRLMANLRSNNVSYSPLLSSFRLISK